MTPEQSRIGESVSAFLARPLWRGITIKRALPYVFVLAGAVLLTYVAAEYGAMGWEQHRLARKWEEQYQAAENARQNGGAMEAIHDDGLIRVSIPKIELDAIVVEGTTRKQLNLGPGHLVETAQPGDNGNAVISAHRDTFFRHIYELNKGDEILVRRRGEVFRFQVTGKKIVDPSDVTVTKQTGDAQLTLITCYPTYYIGPAPERLVVFSKLIDHARDTARASAVTPAATEPGR